MTYSVLLVFAAFLSPDRLRSALTKAFWGLMPAFDIFPLLLGGVWIALLILFVWTHRPEPTIAEIIRALESRS